LGEVTGLDIDGAKLVYKARVKSDLEGTAFLEMWAHVGGGQYFSRGMNDVVKQKTDWKVIQTPFLFQKGEKPDKVTLNLVINGKGTVWIDDIVLSKETSSIAKIDLTRMVQSLCRDRLINSIIFRTREL
jgi:hypothetical protein